MNKRDLGILTLFTNRIRERFPNATVWAYGSRVKGTAAENSDLDVCVVVEYLNEEVDGIIMDLAWQVGFDNDVLISTVTFSKEEFETGPCSESPLVRTILHEGFAA